MAGMVLQDVREAVVPPILALLPALNGSHTMWRIRWYAYE